MKVLIADDHPIFRQGVKQILTEETDMKVVGEAQNAQELLDLVRREECDVVVMDITMPGRSGLEVLREVKQQSPSLPVLILSMHPEDQYGIRSLKAGASGYLNKESAPDKLVYALRKIRSGGRYVSPALAEKLASVVDQNYQASLHESLSDREYQIMCMIASGKTIGDIAQELSLSVKTISTYRGRVLEKMSMRTNAELTYYAVKNELVK